MGMYKIRFRKEKQFRELSLPQKSNDRKYFTHWKPIIHLQISKDIEVVCRDRCRRNTPMFNKKFITFNNQRDNNSYDSHLWLTIESL